MYIADIPEMYLCSQLLSLQKEFNSFHLIDFQLEYGEETWLAILESVGYRNTVFRTHHIYPDDLIMKLADAAVTLVANGSTRQDFLRFFGRCFVRYFSHYGYEKFIKVSFDCSFFLRLIRFIP